LWSVDVRNIKFCLDCHPFAFFYKHIVSLRQKKVTHCLNFHSHKKYLLRFPSKRIHHPLTHLWNKLSFFLTLFEEDGVTSSFFLSTITYATKVNWFWICSWLISSFILQRLYFAKLHGFNHLKELSSWENATLLRKILSFNNSSVVKLLKNKELILLFACVFSWENTHTMMGKAIKLT